MIRILIADDHAIVRKGLKETFEEIPGMVVEAEAGSGAELLEKLARRKIDVVLLDLGMPGQNGLELLAEIKRRQPQLPVLVFTMHSEEEFAFHALKAGAVGYLTKEGSLDELVKAVIKVGGGGRYIRASLAEKLAGYVGASHTTALHETLSAREFEVMSMIAHGQSLKAIAANLSLSEKTISTYRARALEKMGMKTDAELVRYQLQQEMRSEPRL